MLSDTKGSSKWRSEKHPLILIELTLQCVLTPESWEPAPETPLPVQTQREMGHIEF